MTNEALLEVRNLTVRFDSDGSHTEAVRDVSFSIRRGEALAIVGESGSGKSVTALSLTRLLPSPPAVYASGEILLEGRDLLRMPERELRRVRGARIAYVFQEPSTSLNPVFTIGNQIAEAIRLHRPEIKGVKDESVKWLNVVGIVDPEKRLSDYPHQLSGGMQQRVMIAMALSCKPDLLVADEPTTALDVTIQAQIMAELLSLKGKLAILLITHNFAIIRDIAENVAVMFRGRIVEYGPTAEVLGNPQHPYTRALIECIPRLGAKRKRLATIDPGAL